MKKTAKDIKILDTLYYVNNFKIATIPVKSISLDYISSYNRKSGAQLYINDIGCLLNDISISSYYFNKEDVITKLEDVISKRIVYLSKVLNDSTLELEKYRNFLKTKCYEEI